MYLAPVIAGLLIRDYTRRRIPAGYAILVGALFGLVNALCIIKLKITPFVATLSTMVVGRGLGSR